MDAKKVSSDMVDGTELYHESIRVIEELRGQVARFEKAFTAYVTDELELTSTKAHDKPSPPILGFCKFCAFPVYESDVGSGGLYHYTGGRYQSMPLVCGSARLQGDSK